MHTIEFETDVTGRFIELKNYEQFMNQHVRVIVLTEKMPAQTPTKNQYDFSDLAGKLHWNGDALSQQQALRDEW